VALSGTERIYVCSRRNLLRPGTCRAPMTDHPHQKLPIVVYLCRYEQDTQGKAKIGFSPIFGCKSYRVFEFAYRTYFSARQHREQFAIIGFCSGLWTRLACGRRPSRFGCRKPYLVPSQVPRLLNRWLTGRTGLQYAWRPR
jgi:hypothetical protein